jgi:hypothetical protein
VDHLLDGLVILERPVRERLVDRVDVRAASPASGDRSNRPVGTAETGRVESHIGAEHDDAEGEHDARQREAPEETVTGGHGSLLCLNVAVDVLRG